VPHAWSVTATGEPSTAQLSGVHGPASWHSALVVQSWGSDVVHEDWHVPETAMLDMELLTERQQTEPPSHCDAEVHEPGAPVCAAEYPSVPPVMIMHPPAIRQLAASAAAATMRAMRIKSCLAS
jgi:hypothetical protein